MRLIDADKLQEFPIRANRCDKEHANKHFLNGIETVLEYAELLPTVDAVPVVRCKDCKYSYADLEGLCCTYGPPVDCIVPSDYGCVYGKRRKAKNEHNIDEFGRIRREIWEIFHELPETIESEGFERQHDGKIAPPREIVATLRDGTRLRYTRKSNGANKWRYEKDGWYARRCGGGWAKWGEVDGE